MRAHVVVLLGLFVARTAHADAPVKFVPTIDGPVLGVAASAWLGLALAQKSIVTQPTCAPCVAATINPFDRPLAGRNDHVASAISWGTVALTLALPIAIDAGDIGRTSREWRYFAHDMGLFAEAIALDGALNEIVKLAVRRPRPLVYDGSVAHGGSVVADNYVSFYSEHSSLAFTAATAYTTLFALRHRDRPGLTAAVGIALFSLASATASLRVVAGKHFYSDVIVGAAIGTGIGAAVPLLHHYVRRRLPLVPSVVPVAGGALLMLTRL